MTLLLAPVTLLDENTALLSSSVLVKGENKTAVDDGSHRSKRNVTSLGFMLIFLATIPYAIGDILIQTAKTAYGLDMIGSLYISGGTQVLLALSLIISDKRLRASMTNINERQLYLISVFGLLCALSVIFFACALVRLPVGEADAILFLTPALTVLIAYATLGEPVSLPVVGAVVASLLGAYIISWPSASNGGVPLALFSNQKRLEGVALAVLGALFLATSNIPIRAMGTSTSYVFSVLSFSMFLFLASYLCGGYPVALVSNTSETRSYLGVMFALFSGVSMFVGRSLYTQGIQRCPVGQGAFVGTAQIPVALTLGFLLLGQVPTTVHFIGSLLVFSSAVIIGAKHATNMTASSCLKTSSFTDDLV